MEDVQKLVWAHTWYVTVTAVDSGSDPGRLSTLIHSAPEVITRYVSPEETEIIDGFSNGEKDVACNCTPGHSRQTGKLVQCRLTTSAKTAASLSAVNWVSFSERHRLALSPVLHRVLFLLSLPPPLQRQHKAMKDWRQSDVLRFILPESLRMLSVPHEGSDESRLSVRHLIISQKKSLWCYPLTMAHSSLLTTVPTNNEELTAATNVDGVVPTVHLRVRQIK